MVIKNGKIFTPYGFVQGNIVIDNEKIISLTKSEKPNADEEVNAHGNFVLPGMIDMHVHFRDPGHTEREDFNSGTKAAAGGGITTVVDMPNTVPPVTSVKALKDKIDTARRKALVDFAFIGGAGELKKESLISLAREGIVGYKTFMTARFKELAASDGQIYENFLTIAETGLPCLVHAENESIVAWGIEKAKSIGRIDPIAHSEFRLPLAENEATIRTILIAKETRVHLHICHMTTKFSARVLSNAKHRGIQITGETTPSYLLLTSDVMKKMGPYAKIDPPLRTEEDNKSLWKALNKGVIDVVASDHAPYSKEEKDMGWDNIFDAPSGSNGIETSLRLMLNCVNRRMLTLEHLVKAFSTNPAKILNIYPKKGALILGADADIVIVDLKKDFKITGEKLNTKQKITLFEGFKGKGTPLTTIAKGKIVMNNDQVVNLPGHGEFISPLIEENKLLY